MESHIEITIETWHTADTDLYWKLKKKKKIKKKK